MTRLYRRGFLECNADVYRLSESGVQMQQLIVQFFVNGEAFLGWLEDQGLVIEDPSGERLTVVASDLLHEYFGIDRSRLDDEKREMLDDAPQRDDSPGVANLARAITPRSRTKETDMANENIVDTIGWVVSVLSDPEMHSEKRLTRAFHLAAIIAVKDTMSRDEFLDFMGQAYDGATLIVADALSNLGTTH